MCIWGLDNDNNNGCQVYANWWCVQQYVSIRINKNTAAILRLMPSCTWPHHRTGPCGLCRATSGSAMSHLVVPSHTLFTDTVRIILVCVLCIQMCFCLDSTHLNHFHHSGHSVRQSTFVSGCQSGASVRDHACESGAAKGGDGGRTAFHTRDIRRCGTTLWESKMSTTADDECSFENPSQKFKDKCMSSKPT